MPANQTRYDEVLSQFSTRYTNSDYIAARIFKPIPVKHKSDLFPVYDKEHLRNTDDLRMERSAAKEVTRGWKLDSYYCKEHSLREIVTDDESRNTNDAIDIEADTVEFISDALLLNLEVAVATLVTNTGNNGGNANLNWSAPATADPKSDISAGRAAVRALTGKTPNTIAMSAATAIKLAALPKLADDIKYVANLTQYDRPGVNPVSGLPRYLWGMEVLEAGAILNNVKKGVNADIVEVWGNSIWIGYIEKDAPKRKMLTYGALLESLPRMSRSYYQQDIKGTWFETDWQYDAKLIAKECGYLFTTVWSA